MVVVGRGIDRVDERVTMLLAIRPVRSSRSHKFLIQTHVGIVRGSPDALAQDAARWNCRAPACTPLPLIPRAQFPCYAPYGTVRIELLVATKPCPTAPRQVSARRLLLHENNEPKADWPNVALPTGISPRRRSAMRSTAR